MLTISITKNKGNLSTTVIKATISIIFITVNNSYLLPHQTAHDMCIYAYTYIRTYVHMYICTCTRHAQFGAAGDGWLVEKEFCK